MIHNPCLLLLLQLLLRIEAAKRGKEKERLTWSCFLKTKAMVMEGWLTNNGDIKETSSVLRKRFIPPLPIRYLPIMGGSIITILSKHEYTHAFMLVQMCV